MNLSHFTFLFQKGFQIARVEKVVPVKHVYLCGWLPVPTATHNSLPAFGKHAVEGFFV